MTRRRPHTRWGALGAAAAAAAAAARLARGMRIRHGETPRKPLNIAEWALGSNLTVPLFYFWVKEFQVFRASPIAVHRHSSRRCGSRLSFSPRRLSSRRRRGKCQFAPKDPLLATSRQGRHRSRVLWAPLYGHCSHTHKMPSSWHPRVFRAVTSMAVTCSKTLREVVLTRPLRRRLSRQQAVRVSQTSAKGRQVSRAAPGQS